LIIASWNEHKAASAFNPALAASESQFPGRRSNNVDIRAASARLFLQASLSVALNLMTKRERKEEGEREREREASVSDLVSVIAQIVRLSFGDVSGTSWRTLPRRAN